MPVICVYLRKHVTRFLKRIFAAKEHLIIKTCTLYIVHIAM